LRRIANTTKDYRAWLYRGIYDNFHDIQRRLLRNGDAGLSKGGLAESKPSPFPLIEAAWMNRSARRRCACECNWHATQNMAKDWEKGAKTKRFGDEADERMKR